MKLPKAIWVPLSWGGQALKYEKTSKGDPQNVQGSAGQQILWLRDLQSGPAGKGSVAPSSLQIGAGEKLSCGAPGHHPCGSLGLDWLAETAHRVQGDALLVC